MTVSIITRKPDELTPSELYALLQLRADVFIVEQASPYADIDGRDLLEDTLQLWAHTNGTVIGTLRVLNVESVTPSIGRVATAKNARGRGVSGALLTHAISLCRPDATIHLGAQTYLERWYGKYGFVRAGAEYDDVGILHIPMTRTPRQPAASSHTG